MNAERKIYKLKEVVQFNPTERIAKGTLAKKVPMDKLIPYCREVSAYEVEAFTGGMKFRNGDTIMARITPCLENGKTSYISFLEYNEVGFGSTEYIVFRAIEEVADSKFVYYFVTNPAFRNVAIKSMVGSSGRQRVQQSVLEDLEVAIPPLEEQRRIAGILGAIDDKIENNRRINTNLELQAQALFEEWCESCSKTITIKELADNILDYTPNANSKVVLLNSSDVTQGLFAELPLVDNVNLKGQFKKRFQKDDILYSEIRPRNKHYAYCYFDSDRYIASTRLIVLRGKKEKIVSNTLLYQYLISQTVFEEFTLKTETRSGTFPQGNYQDLSSIVVPYSDNQKEIAGSLDVIYEEIWSNYKENETLATLRDTLLPKLMNGEIKL